jgi:hypothetical protein
VGFVVDRMALGQVLLWILQFSAVSIIPPWLCTHIYHWQWEIGLCMAAVKRHSLNPSAETWRTFYRHYLQYSCVCMPTVYNTSAWLCRPVKVWLEYVVTYSV